jgi:hypothetical protein
MLVTRENVPELIAQGLLPEGDLVFHVRSGAHALPLPSLFKTRVRWLVEESQSTAVVTKQSASFPPFTFYEWNELVVEETDDGVSLRFLVRSLGESTPVEILVLHERVSQA